MNYQQLKADDPGGTLDAAFATLSVMTEDRLREQNRIDLRDIYNACGSADGETVIVALETAAQADPIVARALSWAQPGADMGIDICDGEVQDVFNGLVTAGAITQAQADKIIGLQNETVLKYPGLKAGDVEYARGLV